MRPNKDIFSELEIISVIFFLCASDQSSDFLFSEDILLKVEEFSFYPSNAEANCQVVLASIAPYWKKKKYNQL